MIGTCQGVKAHIAIGGWGGSIYFSSNVATAENRTAFVDTVLDFLEKYDLDGVNFEYVCQLHHIDTISLTHLLI